MALEQNNEQHYREIPDKYADPVVTFNMRTFDYVMRPTANGATGPIILYLPPVAEAKGRFYSIIVRKADVINTVTVADLGDSECWGGDIALDGKCDRLLMYSDGLAWLSLTNPGAWPGALTTAPAGTTASPTTTSAP